MLQQIIALIIIVYFIAKLSIQKKRGAVSSREYVFWLVFWLASLTAIMLLRPLDRLVGRLGFSGTGIEVLLYLSVAILFYFIFRIRLRLEKMEKNITTIVRGLAMLENRDRSGKIKPDSQKNNNSA
jgi:small membrane protein